MSRSNIDMNNFISHILAYFKSTDINVIVDVGSMDGNDTVILHNSFPNSKAYSIEGLTDNYNSYIKHKENIIGINAVIASYDGNCTFYEKNINGIHGIYNRGDEYGTVTHTLPCYKLKTIMEMYHIDTIDVIKIDVEGATYDALQSLEDKIYDIKIMHIETETYPFFKGQQLEDTVFSFLTQENFELIDKVSFEILPGKFQTDSVWINKKYK